MVVYKLTTSWTARCPFDEAVTLVSIGTEYTDATCTKDCHSSDVASLRTAIGSYNKRHSPQFSNYIVTMEVATGDEQMQHQSGSSNIRSRTSSAYLVRCLVTQLESLFSELRQMPHISISMLSKRLSPAATASLEQDARFRAYGNARLLAWQVHANAGHQCSISCSFAEEKSEGGYRITGWTSKITEVQGSDASFTVRVCAIYRSINGLDARCSGCNPNALKRKHDDGVAQTSLGSAVQPEQDVATTLCEAAKPHEQTSQEQAADTRTAPQENESAMLDNVNGRSQNGATDAAATPLALASAGNGNTDKSKQSNGTTEATEG